MSETKAGRKPFGGPPLLVTNASCAGGKLNPRASGGDSMNGDRFRPKDDAQKPVSVADILLVAAAVAAFVCASVGVVRALDIALDAVHEQPAVTIALNK
jgi:hypothetical protein